MAWKGVRKRSQRRCAPVLWHSSTLNLVPEPVKLRLSGYSAGRPSDRATPTQHIDYRLEHAGTPAQTFAEAVLFWSASRAARYYETATSSHIREQRARRQQVQET